MRIVSDLPVPVKVVSEETKAEMESLLRKSNSVLKFHHEEAKKSGFSGNRRSFFAILCKSPESRNIPKSDLDLIMDAKKMESDFLCVYSKMMFKIAKKWRYRLDGIMSEEDAFAVASEGFLKAFCCFTDDKTRFSTYLSVCIHRHLQDFAKSCSNQLSIPVKIVRLRAELKRAMGEGLTFDSAAERMNLSAKTQRILAASMSEIKNLGHKDEMVPARPDGAETQQHELSLISAEVSGLEKLVLDEFILLGHNMNLSEISKKTLNPKTKRPYSRMALCLAWKRVRGKICERYGKVA